MSRERIDATLAPLAEAHLPLEGTFRPSDASRSSASGRAKNIRWDAVAVYLTTHMASDVVTELDFLTVGRVDDIAARYGAAALTQPPIRALRTDAPQPGQAAGHRSCLVRPACGGPLRDRATTRAKRLTTLAAFIASLIFVTICGYIPFCNSAFSFPMPCWRVVFLFLLGSAPVCFREHLPRGLRGLA